MRHHLRFKNINGEAIRAAEALFEARPHAAEVTEQAQAAHNFLVAASDAYGVSTPELELGAYLYGRRGVSYRPADRDALGEERNPARIAMRRFSVINLFRGFRQHLLANGKTSRGVDDPLGWACSLYYSVKPIQFRKIARAGRVPGVGPRDTYRGETWNRMVAAGVADTRGRLLIDNFDARDLDAIESGDLDPFGHLDEAVNAAAEVVVQNTIDAAESFGNQNVSCPDCDGHGYIGGEDDPDSEPDECEFCEGNGVVSAARVAEREADQAAHERAEAVEATLPEGTVLGEDERAAMRSSEAQGDDGLDGLGIVALRRLGSGQNISGMWDMNADQLRGALRERGIRTGQ